MAGRYKLDENGNPVEVADLFEWAEWMTPLENRLVQQDIVEAALAKPTEELPDESRDKLAGKIQVSTVFLGLDYNFDPYGGKPVLWETMIFGGKLDGFQRRYTSKEDAVTGHAEALQAVYAADVYGGGFVRDLDYDDN